MKIFLSSLERVSTPLMDYQWIKHLDELPFKLKWNLMSYFYVKELAHQRMLEACKEK